jgi:ribosomal protein S18 acetylase RimI-like enzyme
VIRTPANPAFYWGNFLLFDQPPGEGDFERWTQLFAAEIGAPPEVRHVAFGWDAPDGAEGLAQPFLDAGFQLAHNVVLTTQAVQPPAYPNTAIVVRPMESEQDWERALELLVIYTSDGDQSPGFLDFTRRSMARYRVMAEAGLGAWIGAFDGERMVGGLGIYLDGAIGRFQEVGTHPDCRRMGVCGTLVHWSARYALEQLGAQTLVMVADPEYHAARIYESVGFRPAERQIGMDRAPA